MLNFQLDDDFVARYAERTPFWGFTDAGGNSIGELTFVRSYSRLKDDGKKERWHEVCRRVVEGMYHEQRKWCTQNRIPYDLAKAQRSAEEAYDLMFDRKWAPPGRGLAVMGTPFVHEHGNSAALQNCLAGKTEVITRQGPKRLDELVGETHELWTEKGWVASPVKSYGEQPLQRVTLVPAGRSRNDRGWRSHGRSKVRVEVDATPNHRWVLADGAVTQDIRVGDFVAAERVTAELDSEWWARGFAFGDGGYASYGRNDGTRALGVRLCGVKNRHAETFASLGWVEGKTYDNGDRQFSVRLPDDGTWKVLPTPSTPEAAHSFICGWLDADGWQMEAGASKRSISTTDAAAGEWLERWAAYGGWTLTGAATPDGKSTNFGPRNKPLYTYRLSRQSNAWKVVAIESLGRTETVYCAEVPDVQAFTLASGVYTGNCAFISTGEMTDDNPAEPFTWLMEASMLGVGVGFDTKGAELGFRINDPYVGYENIIDQDVYVVPDTREGWCESLKLLLESYLIEGRKPIQFDYHLVRPAGAPIKTFGGTAAGPGPLVAMHDTIRDLWRDRKNHALSSRDIVDIMNIAGKCVVSGNVRRSAEIAIGEHDDKDYLGLKDYRLPENAARTANDGWAWTSNNSVFAEVGMDYAPIVERIALNGEPGLVWMDITRNYGRLVDPPDGKDYRAAGYNPCGEQPLESREMCTLVNLYPTNCTSLDDFKRAIKYAYLYAKTVTLVATHWPQTNAIMQRNRRIGASFNGAWQFVEQRGWVELDRWMDEGFKEIVHWDDMYSEWMCVRPSIRHTTEKPDGSGALLAGATPGAHASPGSEFYIRRIRYGKDDPVVPLLEARGYHVEPAFGNELTTVVAEFPIAGPVGVRSQDEVNVYEKVSLAARVQKYWSDNAVSFTLTYDKETETGQLEHVLRMFEGQLKSISFLGIDPQAYPQMPYEAITREQYEAYVSRLAPIDWDYLYDGGKAEDAELEKFCTTDVCELPQRQPTE